MSLTMLFALSVSENFPFGHAFFIIYFKWLFWISCDFGPNNVHEIDISLIYVAVIKHIKIWTFWETLNNLSDSLEARNLWHFLSRNFKRHFRQITHPSSRHRLSTTLQSHAQTYFKFKLKHISHFIIFNKAGRLNLVQRLKLKGLAASWRFLSIILWTKLNFYFS